ncbi:MAG: biopolymer transporter ExbD [Flavobacteriales bacterium]|nr:biopolymer transporter ExbD [Flavobacteriales bacterium]
MAKFRKDGKRETPGISTSSLPDIVFMLLFFFMVATKMRTAEDLVRTQLPTLSEVEKVENKSLVIYILVGPPVNTNLGDAPRIQFDGKFGVVLESKDEPGLGVRTFVRMKKDQQDARFRDYLTTALKVDKVVKMGLIQDIKQELRKENSLKLMYSAAEGEIEGY